MLNLVGQQHFRLSVAVVVTDISALGNMDLSSISPEFWAPFSLDDLLQGIVRAYVVAHRTYFASIQ